MYFFINNDTLERRQKGTNMTNYLIDLFLFDEGATSEGTAGETAQDAAAQSGETGQDAAVKSEDVESEFEKLIKGKYREAFGKRTQSIIQERLKGTNEVKSKLDQYQPIVEAAMERYKVNDISELPKAMYLDQHKLESEALEKGITIEQLREIKEQEYENKLTQRELQQLKAEKEAQVLAQQEEAKRQEMFQQWQIEEKDLQKDFPEFAIMKEVENPEFADMLNKGISVKRAYYAIHHDDIVSSIAKHAVDKGKKDAADTIRANGQRPSENLSSSKSATEQFKDSAKFTDEDWKLIEEKMEKGIPIDDVY